jgi:biopolymer transport protein ExbD
MSDSRRIKRMARNNRKGGDVKGLGINLIPMMDVLTVLVFFLLFHSFNTTLPDAQINLPTSVVEKKPRETISIVVSQELVMLQGEPVLATSQIFDDSVYDLRVRLGELRHAVATSAENPSESVEVTVLADKSIPFKVLKRIMSICTASGYGKISLAVIQKESQTKE